MIKIIYAPYQDGRLVKFLFYTDDSILRGTITLKNIHAQILLTILRSYTNEFEINETTLERIYD